MATSSFSNLTIRLDNQKKEDFEVLSRRLGMSMNTAINVFISAALRHGGLPFDVVIDPLDCPEIKANVDKELEKRLAIADSPEAEYYSHEEAKKILGI